MTQRIEALALQTPPLSVAAIHRQVVTLAAAHDTPAPCYRTVYNIIRRIAPALRTLAHHGIGCFSKNSTIASVVFRFGERVGP